MIELNKKTNLLEQKYYNYTLQDVSEPQLFRDVFDYQSVPKIVFNARHVPMSMPEDIWITDTTFRDGQQSTSPFTDVRTLAFNRSALSGSSSRILKILSAAEKAD